MCAPSLPQPWLQQGNDLRLLLAPEAGMLIDRLSINIAHAIWNMPKNRSKGATAASLYQSTVPADDKASAHSSQQDIAGHAAESSSPSFDHLQPSLEQEVHDATSATASTSEQSDEDNEAPAGHFDSAHEAAAAAFGSEDLGDIGAEKAEGGSEDDMVVRIPVDWSGEFESSFCGLRNVGNTCFLNSVGMLLAHCPGVFWHCMFDLVQTKDNSDEYFIQSR
jgi:hypothetical protein